MFYLNNKFVKLNNAYLQLTDYTLYHVANVQFKMNDLNVNIKLLNSQPNDV